MKKFHGRKSESAVGLSNGVCLDVLLFPRTGRVCHTLESGGTSFFLRQLLD
jgi:hypothetical protein